MDHILITKDGSCGRLILNRPTALNALDLPMVTALARGLARHLADPELHCVLLTSTSPKAFCAGGDVRAAVTLGQSDPAAASQFFRAEYQLNYAIATASKPVIALVDGLCMGGGMGLSVHARHCVVTARALMAMPEMMIGLFPDVGAGEFLNRRSAALGRYLALTGARLGPEDCLYAGLASAFLPNEAQERFVELLCAGQLDQALALTQSGAPAPLADVMPLIETCFASDDMSDIRAALEGLATPWAQAQLQALESGSPTSQALTLRHLALSREQRLDVVLHRDFRLASHCLLEGDFAEGVRALLIDKDKTPRWQPLERSRLARYFEAAPWPDWRADLA